MADRYATGGEPVVDAPTVKGTVVNIRPGRIAVVRLEGAGRCYDSEIPAAMLGGAVREGDEFDISAARRPKR